jgi:uncharacterized membrane protein HdeD (DUF308 family)
MSVQEFQVEVPHEVAQYWGWFFAFGIGLVLLGGVALVRSIGATIATMLLFGWLLVLAAAIEIAQAVLVGHWAGFFHHLFAAVLFGLVGLLLVSRPVGSAEALTLLMGLFFLISGAFQFVASLMVGLTGWGWQALDGVITFVLGVMLISQWPVSGLWAIGLFLGIDLIFYGLAWMAISLSLRSA